MIVAITGGVGSGKSQVMQMLKELGGVTLSADKINSDLLCREEYIEELGKLFPEVVEEGVINKKALGRIVFYDAEKMKALNELAHPVISKEIMEMTEDIGKTRKHIFIEMPLLVEVHMQDMFDKIWLVKASKELCLKRIIMRDLVDENYAQRIMANQATDKIREEYCTDIIENNGTYDSLYERLKELFLEIKKEAKAK